MLADQDVESPGTAEVWRLPTIDHGTVMRPVLSRSGYLARIQPVPLFPKCVNFAKLAVDVGRTAV